MLTFETDLEAQRARARALGITLKVDETDRDLTVDRRGPNACPTCVDGVRTIETPRRCRQCVADGL